MTKSKNTKRALLTSVLSVLLCCAMLVGSTFAWFTDSVTSGKNKIVAGNLDIEVTHANDVVKNQSLQDADDLFPITLWEPGVVSYETFTVTNKGTLAFDYEFRFTAGDFNKVVLAEGTETELSLKDVIQIGVIEGDVEGKTREQLIADVKAVAEVEGSPAMKFVPFKDVNFADYMLAAEKDENPAEKTFTVVAYWEPNVMNDNDYNVNNGKSVDKKNANGKDELYIDIAVNVFAKQRTYEKDSFNEYYDAEAYNPDANVETLSSQGYTVVASAEDIPKNAEKIVLKGNIKLSDIVNFADGAVFDANGYTVTVDHVYAIGNPDSKNGNEKGAKNITIKNAVFEGSAWGAATGSATYENCTFNNIDPYITPNNGMNISVKNCVFNNAMLQIAWCEGETVDPATITTEIVGNTFNYTATGANSHIIALNAGAYSDFSKVNVSNNTFNNKGVAAFSALYKTTASAESIKDNYKNNIETNASVGYKGSDGYARNVADEEAIYVVFDNGTKILEKVTVDTEEYTIPSDVTKLGDSVFSGTNVKKVTVPASVTDLGRGFNTTNVEEVILSEGLETISSRAFRNTPNLKSVVIPSTVKTIVENAFQQSGIETIVIPASVESIEFAGLGYCANLTTVTIEGNPEIANYAFRDCANLTDVYLKGNDVTFAENAAMIFTNTQGGVSNKITIHVANETVKERLEVAQKSATGYKIVIDQTA